MTLVFEPRTSSRLWPLPAPAHPPAVPGYPDLGQYLQGLAAIGHALYPDPTLLTSHGDLDVSGSFRATVGSDAAPSFDAFAMTSSEGKTSLSYQATSTSSTQTGTWTLTVRGAPAIVVQENFPTSSSALQWRAGDDITWRAWFRPGINQAGIRLSVNGVVAPDTTTTATGGLAAPTVATLGCSFVDATQWQVFVARTSAQTPGTSTPEFLVVGDSTSGSFWYEALQGPNVGAWSNLVSVAHDVYSVQAGIGINFVGQRGARAGIGLLAVPGDTCSGQQTKFDASPWSSQSGIAAVIVQCGINDRGSGVVTATAALQSLINDIKAKRPTAKVLVAEVVPFDLYLNGDTTFLYPFNQNIMGTGANPITGVDARISAHYTALDNGSGGYIPQYNFDNIHENNAGRAVVASAYRNALIALGLLS